MNNKSHFLSREEISFFRATGYLKLPSELDASLIESIKSDVEAELANPCKFLANGKPQKLYNLIDRISGAKELIYNSVIIDPLKSILGNNIELTLNRHNQVVILDRETVTHSFHRDVQHWTRPTISAFVYLQDTSIENGCTHIIPGSDQFCYINPSNDSTHGGTWLSELENYQKLERQALPVPCKKGEILLVNSLTFHSAGINSTDKNRYVLTYSFHASDELDATPSKKLSVSGNRTYKGNDLSWEKDYQY